MRYTIVVGEPLETRLKIVAAKTKRTLQSMGLEAIEQFVTNQEQTLAEAEAARDAKQPEAVAA